MYKHILTIDSTNYEIDEYKLNRYEFVSSYSYKSCYPELNIYQEFSTSDKDVDMEYYYIFDSPTGDAFAHWIFESFIFYPIFLHVKKLYPTIKILVPNNKRYIKNFVDFVKIDSIIVNKIQTTNNTCFFNPLLSLNVSNEKSLKLLEYFTIKMRNYITSNISSMSQNKLIVLPRNSKDNYVGNDRHINTEDIEKNVISKGGTVLDTYQINNINIQFSLVNSFDCIIVCFGSSYFVNCIFLKNKTIIVLDHFNYYNFHKTFEANSLIFNMIEKQNNVKIVSSGNILYSDIEKLI